MLDGSVWRSGWRKKKLERGSFEVRMIPEMERLAVEGVIKATVMINAYFGLSTAS